MVIRADLITEEQRAQLERAFPGSVMEISDQQLLNLGMTRGVPWLF